MLKVTFKKSILLFMITAAFAAVIFCACGNGETAYVASDGPVAKAYTADENGELKEAELVRGTEVAAFSKKTAGPDGEDLVAIQIGEESYYIDPDLLKEEREETVLESKVFVRTPVTIYVGKRGPEITGFAPKNASLEVAGFDRIRKDGTVNKYKIKFDDIEGYVYSKYLAASKKAAAKVCNDKGAYDMAKDSRFPYELYGGKATHLDYFPYERTDIKDNEFCTDARAMYLHAGAVMDDKYFKLAKKSGVNAVVINIDGGTLAYRSPVAKELSPTAYKKASHSLEKYQKAVRKYEDAGFYTIGRIVCFNDRNYAKDHPEECIKMGGKTTSWVSAYSRNAWYYKVALAREAVQLMGFNEIQYDYVRFPEEAYEMSASKANFRNKYDEEKAQAIQNFCFYAADQIHEAGAYFSVDVFGESSNGYVPAYGQYWPAISNIVDAISAMPYTDHYGDSDTWSKPYKTIYNWAKQTAGMQKHLPTPALPRTWVTGYDTPHWNPTVDYDYKKLRRQVDALEDAGLDGGFIPWNSACSYYKYEEYSKIWAK